ncbi:MAG: hypothetical protein NT015_12405 [Alphaproteobacteria bacterium]|nr:hypothetical protein [Alphaproteobacteria bacterium]
MYKILTAFVALVLLGACTTIASYEGTRELRDVGSIAGSKVYVYSFLQVGRNAIGPGVLENIDAQLTQRLSESSVTVGFGNASTVDPLDGQIRSQPYDRRFRMPVREIVDKNRANEEEFGAAYRLLIVPRFLSMSQYSGDGGQYVVTWALIEIASEEIVWQTQLNGAYTPLLYDNERAVERAGLLVDGAIEEMRASGLLDPNGAETSAPSPEGAEAAQTPP